MLHLFLVILSWVLLVISVIWMGLALYMEWKYIDSLEQALDRHRGIERSWPVSKPFFIMVITISLLVAHYLT